MWPADLIRTSRVFGISRMICHRRELGPRTLAIDPPSSSLERDFCRRRQTTQKGSEDDISAQRPEIRHHHTREMAAKTAFLLASYQLRVSEDWVAPRSVSKAELYRPTRQPLS
jgi:hypothetical protein